MSRLKQHKKRLKMDAKFLRGANGKLRSAEEVEDEAHSISVAENMNCLLENDFESDVCWIDEIISSKG